MQKKFLSILLCVLFLQGTLLLFADTLFAYLTESNTVTTRVGNPPLEALGGPIQECTFYRGGDRIPGVKMGNPELANVINDIANRVGVPPAIVAGILRVETSGAFATTDMSYLANDYDAHSSGVAYGAMQFVPSTFTGIYEKYKEDLRTLFGKTDVRTSIDPQGAMAPENVFRIYSIKDSITAAALKVKSDKESFNGSGPWDQAAVNHILNRYYGCLKYPSCTNGPHDYGEDVWRSYSNCQESLFGPGVSPIPGDYSCPVPRGPNNDGIVTCGPSAPTNTSYPACNAGHCAGDYPQYDWCIESPATNYAIDVPARPYQDVILPQITYPSTRQPHRITCELQGITSGKSNPLQIIVPFQCQDEQTGSVVWIQYHHMLRGSQPSSNGPFNSGQVVAKVEPDVSGGFPHVHVQVGIGGPCYGTNTASCVGADKYLQCR